MWDVKFTRSSVDDNSSSGSPGSILDDEVTRYPQGGANHGGKIPMLVRMVIRMGLMKAVITRYPLRENSCNPGNRFDDYVVGTWEDSQVDDIVCNYFYRVADILTNYSEAMSSVDNDIWKKAMEWKMRWGRWMKMIHLRLLPCWKATRQWGLNECTLWKMVLMVIRKYHVSATI